MPANSCAWFRGLASAGLALALADAAPAVEVSGATLPPEITVSGERLVLAGCGLREALFMDLYVIGLYVADPPLDRSQILSERTAKAVRLNVVYDGTVPDEVPEEWRESLAEVASRDIRRTLQGFYTKITDGDRVTIAYAPDDGTSMTLNGETIVEKPGHGLIEAMLRLWIGEEAVSGNLRRLLLQGSCPPDDDWF